MLSIIIPTLNEEKYLPNLLESIKKQDFNNYEIIVADAGSKDRTIEIAKNFGCKIIKGGLPAQGRNNGAKEARGEILFFLDADTLLPERFLMKSVREFCDRNLGIAGSRLHLLPERKITLLFMNLFYNKIIVLLEEKLPHSAVGIFIRKDVFEKLGGFDEGLKLAEDHDLARRAAKIAKFGVIKTSEIFMSDRRFRRDGWIKTGIRYVLCELHMILLGPIRSDIFKYRFNHYNDKNSS